MDEGQIKIRNRIIIDIFLLIALALLFGTVDVQSILNLGETGFNLLRFFVYLVPYLIIGFDILKEAWEGLKNRKPFDENFLMAVASLGAMLLGEFQEGCAVMLFYQIGELFEDVAAGKSRKNIVDLMDIRPDYADVEMPDKSLKRVDPNDVKPGSVVVVKPGEKVPIDGLVLEGNGTLDTAALTGESVPRNIHPGETIISGCINMTETLRIKTTTEFGESTVSKILKLVETAAEKKSKMENFITRFARVYTPLVCLLALILAVPVPLLRMALGFAAQFSIWIYRALSFLVISCPCALVISIPLSFFGGIGGAGKAGILIKGSAYLEALSDTKYMLMDKTGTLTRGVFEVAKIVPCKKNEDLAKRKPTRNKPLKNNEYPSGIEFSKNSEYPSGIEFSEISADEKNNILKLAAYAESYSTHPIAESLKKAYGKNIDNARLRNVQEISGEGVESKVDGIKVLVGNYKLMDRNSIKYDPCNESGTIVYVAREGEYLGYVLIEDKIKPNSKAAVEELKITGVKEIIMLTGDNQSIAEKISEEIGIDKYYAGLLPADKVQKVEEVLDKCKAGEKCVFAGDGINDAPVLMRADVGIAMGALGSDAAIEAADVVLMDDDPQKIAKAIRISKKCMRIVRENIVFAIGVKLICLILVGLGIANMWLAIFADVGVMVIAVLNAVRALSVKNI